MTHNTLRDLFPLWSSCDKMARQDWQHSCTPYGSKKNVKTNRRTKMVHYCRYIRGDIHMGTQDIKTVLNLFKAAHRICCFYSRDSFSSIVPEPVQAHISNTWSGAVVVCIPNMGKVISQKSGRRTINTPIIQTQSNLGHPSLNRQPVEFVKAAPAYGSTWTHLQHYPDQLILGYLEVPR